MTMYSSQSEFVLPEAIVTQHERPAPAQGTTYAVHGKRILDLVLVFVAAPVWVPLLALLAALVALSGGQPFYTQRRLGRNGRVFTLWKLRSMIPGGEALLQEHLAANPAKRDEWERNQKIEDDPRITWIGAILRRTSLDELPQLWNVVKGDMSLVGPRPMLPEQRPLYLGRSYFDLRPGITGLWQISGGSRLPFSTRSEYDDRYARGLSLLGDFRILATTVAVVLCCTGR